MSGGGTADGLRYLCELLTNGEYAADYYYVALVKSIPPGFSSTGFELDEPQTEGYQRAEIANDSDGWVITDNTASNAYEVTFPPADEDWGSVGYWAICDEESGGRALFVGQFDPPVDVPEGATVVLSPGAVGISMSGTEWRITAP